MEIKLFLLNKSLENTSHYELSGENEIRKRQGDQKATKDNEHIRKGKHTTFAYSTEGNTRHRGIEAV